MNPTGPSANGNSHYTGMEEAEKETSQRRGSGDEKGGQHPWLSPRTITKGVRHRKSLKRLNSQFLQFEELKLTRQNNDNKKIHSSVAVISGQIPKVNKNRQIVLMPINAYLVLQLFLLWVRTRMRRRWASSLSFFLKSSREANFPFVSN